MVTSRNKYSVVEKGWEIFKPDMAGMILPHAQIIQNRADAKQPVTAAASRQPAPAPEPKIAAFTQATAPIIQTQQQDQSKHVTVEKIEINNPLPETASESAEKRLRRLNYIGYI